MSDANEGNGQAPTIEAILQERHRVADQKWDELSSMQARLKAWADKNCKTCYGRGWTGMESVPIFQPNSLAPGGRLKVGSYPRLLACRCVQWLEKEVARLHQENVSSSQISLAVRQDLVTIRQELRDLSRSTIGWWILQSWRILVFRIKQRRDRKRRRAEAAKRPATPQRATEEAHVTEKPGA